MFGNPFFGIYRGGGLARRGQHSAAINGFCIGHLYLQQTNDMVGVMGSAGKSNSILISSARTPLLLALALLRRQAH